MPQIWLTYQELVDEGFQPDEGSARQAAINSGLTRKRSRDGLSRVLLNEELTATYVLNAAARYGDSANKPTWSLKDALLRDRVIDTHSNRRVLDQVF